MAPKKVRAQAMVPTAQAKRRLEPKVSREVVLDVFDRLENQSRQHVGGSVPAKLLAEELSRIALEGSRHAENLLALRTRRPSPALATGVPRRGRSLSTGSRLRRCSSRGPTACSANQAVSVSSSRHCADHSSGSRGSDNMSARCLKFEADGTYQSTLDIGNATCIRLQPQAQDIWVGDPCTMSPAGISSEPTSGGERPGRLLWQHKGHSGQVADALKAWGIQQ
eukprot:gnl/TRDRNA2_/TRDRNA2_182403_c0_seq1.p1 gnl/TRDRNA2_/TRDRNA2_182403_c0~~gnl/TRDRNA2_/TRDRNA2_182403_c0_seq1.p1  ORF type:complete len:223 (-),score=35.00 gnl/TRDRNA2_/TRDRNA2_182403_c0_seq1:234-902(-)